MAEGDCAREGATGSTGVAGSTDRGAGSISRGISTSESGAMVSSSAGGEWRDCFGGRAVTSSSSSESAMIALDLGGAFLEARGVFEARDVLEGAVARTSARGCWPKRQRAL